MIHDTSSPPPITQLLSSKGSNTLGHETNLSRSPIWQARQRPVDEDTVVSPVLYGHPFRKIEGKPLTTSDQRLFAHFTTKYLRDGCPSDRHISFSLGEAAQTIGHGDLGGRQRSLIRASLSRLQSVTVESALRHPDGHETVLGWRLIDNFLITTRGGGKGWITLNEAVAHLLREGSVTFLHAPTWDAIRTEDEVAGRLWSFLESENLGSGWRYSLFPPDGRTNRATPSMPSIAQLLQLTWSSRQRRVAQRVREACLVIERHDRRYRLTLTIGSRSGSWVLTCMRTQTKRSAPTAVIPEAVIQAWRHAYRSHVPSQSQRAVLFELLSRHSSEWIVRELELSPEADDPFRCLLQTDRRLADKDLASARVAEDRWEEEKQRESSTGEQSLMELIGSVARHFQAVPDADD